MRTMMKRHQSISWIGFALVVVLRPTVVAAADNSWKGTTSANWSDGTNWSSGSAPGSGDVARFDNQSTANLNIVNDASNVSILGFGNTTAGAGNSTGPNIGGTPTPVTITGNPITLGANGIIHGSGNPLDPIYPGPAQVNLTIDVDLTLSADQRWKDGGPGTNTAGRDQAIVVGASPNGRTVTLNGFKPTLTVISNANDMIVVNSKLVDGSTPSQIGISKATGSATTFTYDTGNINTVPRVRIMGDNTYSGGTTIIGGRQLIQLGSSSVKSGSTLISGPLGTGPINSSDSGNDQSPRFVAYLADRELGNEINLPGGSGMTIASSTGFNDDTGAHTLTFGGTINLAGNSSFVQNNQIIAHISGSGDAIFNGTINLNGVSGTLNLGQGGTSPASGVAVGKQVFNGNIMSTGSYTLSIANGTAAVPSVVQLAGQNTYANTTLTATNGTSPTASANLGIGSSTTLDGGGNIVSGPLGLGTLSIGSATVASASSIEALGGARTVANPIALSLGQSILVVRGSNDLTLSGDIIGAGSIYMNGTGKLALGGTDNIVGETQVNSGTMLVNSPGSLTTSGVTVANGATLGGTGSISAPVTSTGAVAPGASIGKLTLNNSLTLNATSSLNFELGAGGSHDLLNVGTDVTLPGTGSGTVTVNLTNLGGLAASPGITLIDYSGSLNGDFSNLVLGTQPSGFTYSLINDTANTAIKLQVTAAPGGVQGDYNGNGVVDAADYVVWRNGGPLQNEVTGVTPGTVTPEDYDAWRARLGNTSGSGSGAVPEPAAVLLLMLGISGGLSLRARRHP